MWYVIRINLLREDSEYPNDAYAQATIVGTFANESDATDVARILNLSDNDAVVIEKSA